MKKDKAEELIKQTKEFIEDIEEYLRKEGYGLGI